MQLKSQTKEFSNQFERDWLVWALMSVTNHGDLKIVTNGRIVNAENLGSRYHSGPQMAVGTYEWDEGVLIEPTRESFWTRWASGRWGVWVASPNYLIHATHAVGIWEESEDVRPETVWVSQTQLHFPSQQWVTIAYRRRVHSVICAHYHPLIQKLRERINEICMGCGVDVDALRFNRFWEEQGSFLHFLVFPPDVEFDDEGHPIYPKPRIVKSQFVESARLADRFIIPDEWVSDAVFDCDAPLPEQSPTEVAS